MKRRIEYLKGEIRRVENRIKELDTKVTQKSEAVRLDLSYIHLKCIYILTYLSNLPTDHATPKHLPTTRPKTRRTRTTRQTHQSLKEEDPNDQCIVNNELLYKLLKANIIYICI